MVSPHLVIPPAVKQLVPVVIPPPPLWNGWGLELRSSPSPSPALSGDRGPPPLREEAGEGGGAQNASPKPAKLTTESLDSEDLEPRDP